MENNKVVKVIFNSDNEMIGLTGETLNFQNSKEVSFSHGSNQTQADWFKERLEKLRKDPFAVSHGIMLRVGGQIAGEMFNQCLDKKSFSDKSGISIKKINKIFNSSHTLTIFELAEMLIALDLEADIIIKKKDT